MEDSELDVPVADNVWARCEASLVPSDEWLEDIVPIIFYEVNLQLIKIPSLDIRTCSFSKMTGTEIRRSRVVILKLIIMTEIMTYLSEGQAQPGANILGLFGLLVSATVT